ncbi:alpha/beta hydrolase [Myxosarcina sp. GI1]|uniref:alpha/beta hydrolase n=1 Tax=Myxosarcina sp. GI1 TaxID=1541065 RepID=UPI00068C4BBC|nr:alpha/beta hydrolase [Myxosarcina sp. GI1]
MIKIENIEYQQGKFLGAGAIKLYYQSWHPNSKTTAVVAIVHGLGGHSDTFDNLVELLCDRAIAVYAFDLRGHGRSEGQRGYINSWSEFREDLHAFLQLITTQELNLPLFLLGQSLGGAIALDYALHYPEQLKGLILLSPALKVRISPLKLLAGRIFSRFIPHFSLNTGIDLADGSRDPQVVAAAMRDPLRHTKGTARLATEFSQAVSWIEANAAQLQVPLLILHGGADRITPLEGSRWLFETVALADKELHEYPESYHELNKDLDYREVFTDIENWLKRL